MEARSSQEALAALRRHMLSGMGQSVLDMCTILMDGRTDIATEEDVYFCFRLILGRDPNPEEIFGHFDLAGMDVSSLVSMYVNSREFDDRRLFTRAPDNIEVFQMQGFSMYADPTDGAVGKHIPSGIYEAHVSRLFRGLIRPDNVIVDIGANIGYFTMLAAHLATSTGRVIAVEPNPANCRLIEASRRLNGFEHVELHCVAASQVSQALVLNTSSSNGMVGQPSDDFSTLMRSQMVPAVRLDDILQLERLDLLKIDVEGHELAALQGFQRHLSKYRPVVVSEFSPHAMREDAYTYLRMFTEMEYRLGILTEDEIHEFGTDCDSLINNAKRWEGDHVDIVASIAPITL